MKSTKEVTYEFQRMYLNTILTLAWLNLLKYKQFKLFV